MFMSLLLFSLMDANVKWLGATYPTAQIMFFRTALAMVPVLVIIYLRGGIAILRIDVIPAPEPGFAIGLALGALGAVLHRARRR